jgi:lysozyme family protein
MANISLYFPKVLQFEGGFVNDAIDRGGSTNMDVTLSTFQSMGFDNNGDHVIDVQDLKLETPAEAETICKKLFWDKWQADNIVNQSVGEILVEWFWGSGYWGIKIPQRLLGLQDDGVVGNKTLSAVNAQNQEQFHAQIMAAKITFINQLILNHPEQEKFRNGWLRRINSFVFEP